MQHSLTKCIRCKAQHGCATKFTMKLLRKAADSHVDGLEQSRRESSAPRRAKAVPLLQCCFFPVAL